MAILDILKARNFSQPIKANSKVSVLKASLFSKDSLKKIEKNSDESRLRITKKNGKFSKFGKY